MKDRYESLDEYIADLQSEIADSDGKCANHHYNLGVALLSKLDFVAAEECFLETLRQSPHMAEALVQLGGICLQRNDLDGCLRYNEEAAQCRAKFAVPWSNIGFVHLQRGEVEKAVKALKKALNWDPNFVQAKATLASACFMSGDYTECVRLAREVVKKEPGFGPAWNNLSLALFEQGDQEGAVEAARTALECGYDVEKPFLKDLGL